MLLLVRPFELFSWLQDIPLLPLVATTTVLGVAIDASLGTIKPRATGLVVLAAAWFGWGLVTALVSPTGDVLATLGTMSVPASVFFPIALGTETTAKLERLVFAVVGSCLVVGSLCLHLGTRPQVCIALPDNGDPNADGVSDGRPCLTVEECWRDPPILEASYRCERMGPFGNRTVDGGRVRYVGVLSDPNEVALALALAVPLALGLRQQRPRSKARALLLATTVVVATAVVLASGSRSGMLVLAVAPLGCAIANGRGRQVVGALVVGALVLLLGGRSGQHADASTHERLEIWFEGLAMLRSNPLTGVGRDQFTRHHPLTAHNSFLLAAAEDGLIGLTAWSALALGATGLGRSARRAARETHDETQAIWSKTLGPALAALFVGSMFLSLNRHVLTWIHLGLAAAVSNVRAPRRATSSRPERSDVLEALLFGLLVVSLIWLAVRVTSP